MTETVVRATNVGKTYMQGAVSVEALSDVSFDVIQGDFVSLVGPSGSGKSTLLHILGALDAATTGTVEVDSVDLNGLSQSKLTNLRLNKIGFVFQAYNLVPVLSALENVEFILHLQGVGKSERRARARETLIALGLEKEIDRRPTEMSGGQQQRVAVARAIVSDPILLLADEPSANLDTQTTSELCGTLRSINQDSGMTIVTATHDPLVMGFAARRIDLKDGEVVKDVRV
ncbi:MAG: ABC transporter ATP-binding protein [Gammaproteobacteria bacterium]|nr:ABC transporter ATP-binding protein [Gammaproteobacteria bacterium]